MCDLSLWYDYKMVILKADSCKLKDAKLSKIVAEFIKIKIYNQM
jgi:hypothetical protein